MESGVGAEALRAWDATRRRLLGSRGGVGDDVAAGTAAGSRVVVPRHESGRTTFPAPLAADMRTGSLAARWFPLRNGYGGAQHVSW